MEVIKRCLTYIKPYKTSFFLSIIFNIFYALLSVLALTMMTPVLNILFGEKINPSIKKEPIGNNITEWGDALKNNLLFMVKEFKDEYGLQKTLLIFCVVFIILFFFRNVFKFISQYFFLVLKSGGIRDMRIQLHDKLLRLPLSFFSEKRKGDIISRLSNDVNEIENNVFGSFVELFRAPISAIIILFSLFLYSPQLTLFSLIIFPIMGTVISLIGTNLKRQASKAQGELGVIFSYIDETVIGNNIIKIFNAQKHMAKRFNHSVNRLRRLLIRVFTLKELSSPISEWLGAITIAMVVYYGGVLSIEGKGLPGSQFTVYIGMFYMLLDPIKSLAKAISEMQKGEVSAKRVFDVLDENDVIRDAPGAIEVNEFKNDITIDNISFGYEGQTVIENFSLKIPYGKTVALVGHSGSGKSTLANLLVRFYDPDKGSIKIDGIDIRDIKLDSYRKLFGVVTQKSILFNDTIYNNIALGIESPNKTDIENAAMVANAHDFISGLPDKYDTNIGDTGAKLSGGQQQRLCIARAVMKNPPIMILDEATSSLDTESEKQVQKALDNLLKDRTSIVIAHRLSTIQKADIIVVMEKGKIIEQGTHLELLQKDGTYKKYIELQNLNTE